MSHIRIYNLDREADCDYWFMDYEFAKNHGFSMDDYYLVYECDREINSFDDIFEEFNIHKPKDYKGHSLSVCDIIEIDGKKWYCDPFGWYKV